MEAYEPCHQPFLRYCSALAFGKMDAEDLVQDAILAAYQRFDRIRDKKKLLCYLIRAARNRSITNWKKRSRQQELTALHEERLLSNGASAEVLADVELLYEAIHKLPAKPGQALILFEISGFSIKEIAEIQGSTESAVKARVSRARKRLKRMLTSHSEAKLQQLFKTAQSITL